MRRRERILSVIVALSVAVGALLILTYAGAHGVGPLSRVLDIVASRVSSMESRYVRRVRGHSRADSLAWLAPYRNNLQALREPDRILLGAYDAEMPSSYEGILNLEQELGTRFPLMHFYSAWGDKPEQQFPLITAETITELGSIPVITWEPWLVTFENQLHPDIPLRDKRELGGLAAIANGTYDFYIDRWARDAAKFRRPLFLRFAHEMNDPYRYPWGPQNNAPPDYIAAFRHVVERFRAAHATNVLFVWAPHVGYKGFEGFYPGDAWVDWVGTGVLNYGTVARWSDWWSFALIFGEKYPLLARHHKPIMIAELGSLAVGGDRRKWFADAFGEIPRRYPLVKAVMFFNVPHDMTVTYQALDWTFTQDTSVLTTVRQSLTTWPK